MKESSKTFSKETTYVSASTQILWLILERVTCQDS